MGYIGLDFLKVSGTGNDFIVIVNFKNAYDYDWPNLARILCKRSFSVGADGLVILEESQKADARMRIFNPDGSEAEMCGNAARCSARILIREEITSSNNVTLETISGIITAQVKGNNVKIKMTQPKDFRSDVTVKIDDTNYRGSFINTGVPHTVFFTEDIEKIALSEIGSKVRHDKQFQPEGTNVNFVQVSGSDSISIRTYERGVENETYACGTGAVASSIVSFSKGFIKTKKVKVLTKGGELTVEIEGTREKIENVYLESPVEIVYEGKYLPR